MPDSSSNTSPALEPGWQNALAQEFEKDYMKSLKAFLLKEKENGATVYPKNSDIFNAFNHTPLDQAKVVIIGQDPYHGPGQAHGLAFSVQKGVAVPPSLRNIYKELHSDISGFQIPVHGNLMQWADRGVLLLNATLTVRAHEAGSHQGKGWEKFTDQAIRTLSEKKQNLVFLLWGRFAQNKSVLIDETKHTILKAAHPSPLSAHNGFLGCKHFYKSNEILVANGLQPIDWQIT
jgi:uracil-DNA glycosylase